MKYLFSLIVLLVFASFNTTQGQVYPDLEFSIENTIAQTSSTADVSFFAGTNWQNITSFSGTVTFDTTKITWNSMSFWGLSNPGGANFTYLGGGVLSFTWTSLITIGPTLSPGSTIFTLTFNTVGSPGDVSPVTFSGSPQPAAWQNGFGWSGNNFLQSNGSVTLTCGVPVPAFTSTATNYSYNFTHTGTGASSYLWDFGDGNTSTAVNPTHTYTTTGQYTVCLTTVNSCGADSTCQVLNVACPLPVTAFTDTVNGLTANFSDQTANAPTLWFWDFGDGNTSTQQNPSHAYANYGSYTVCLTTSNACGTDSSCATVNVICPVPVATFADTATNLQVLFVDQSTNSPTSWFWDFGDGNTSTQQSPTHAYAAPGNYLVCLTVSSACGTDSSCSSISVTCPAPSTAFTHTVNALQVQYVDQTTGGAAFWLWDFGDGNTSSLQNPQHVYASPGTYTVCLTTTSLCGSDSSCASVTVVCPSPDVAFSESSTGLQVQFTDATTNTPTAWIWDFGDGNTSTQQNPTHTYAVPGSYLVCLTATNACGTDSACSSLTVSCPAPVSDFTQVNTNLVVQFTDQSTNGPTAWAWDFGDGNTSTQQNPSNTYPSDGVYNVCLVATSNCGSDSFCTDVDVIVANIADPLSISYVVYPSPTSGLAWVQGPKDENLEIQLYDLQGSLMNLYAGVELVTIETETLSHGLYIIVINSPRGKFVRKLYVK